MAKRWRHVPERVITGGLTGQGFQNLLGRPKLSPLTLLIREAAQNSWDARAKHAELPAGGVRFGLRYRRLSVAASAVFRELFREGEESDPTEKGHLAELLNNGDPVPVLEISDFGTLGLTGSVRADLPVGDQESRFIDFFFDVGKGHADSEDGGTYGFGRSSLYLMGSARTILVDSLVDVGRGTERRLMGSRIGPSYEINNARVKARYSGRHFWGAIQDGSVVPLLDEDADQIADLLALPPRVGKGSTGTTILIPWPLKDQLQGQAIVEVILRHLWPKMVATEDGRVPMEFTVEVDNHVFPVPDPASLPNYRLMTNALVLARTRSSEHGAEAITTLRPRVTTGHLAVLIAGQVGRSALPRRPGNEEIDAPEGDDSKPVINQVALMRPSELVVKYLPVAGTSILERDWAGVFICSHEKDVRDAFAGAEPPAHDDWVSDRLEERRDRYIVKKTVGTLIPDAVLHRLGITLNSGEPMASDGVSLAGVSARFSEVFLAGPGALPGLGESSEPVPPVASSRRRRVVGVGKPRALGLSEHSGIRTARFVVPVSGPMGTLVRLVAEASIHAEGVLDEPPTGVVGPYVLGWGGVDDYTGDLASLRLGEDPNEVAIDVAILGDYAIRLECRIDRGQER